MCGCRSVYAALQWGRDHGREMAERLGLGWHGIPTDGMMGNLPRRVDRVAFEAVAEAVAAAFAGGPAIPGGIADVVAVDGKTPWGARGHEVPGHGVPGVHLLAAYSARLGLGQVSVGANKEDGGEDHGRPGPAGGARLTGEGRDRRRPARLHALRELCRRVTDPGRDGGAGDYLLTVKDNQPTLHAAAVDVFRFPSPGARGPPAAPPFSQARATVADKHGSRVERRTLTTSGELASWPGGAAGRG